MALDVENGTQVVGSNGYVSVAELKAFIGTIPLPAATDTELERAIILATRYLDGKYRPRWKGHRVQPASQSLEWPRACVTFGVSGIPSRGQVVYANYLPSDVIPQRLKDACCELALRAVGNELAPDTTSNIKREKVDVLETEYFVNAIPKQTYQVVDQLLSDYLKSNADMTLIRS